MKETPTQILLRVAQPILANLPGAFEQFKIDLLYRLEEDSKLQDVLSRTVWRRADILSLDDLMGAERMRVEFASEVVNGWAKGWHGKALKLKRAKETLLSPFPTNEAKQKAKRRQHFLDPVISLAQSKCKDPWSTNEVFAQLQILAKAGSPPPLIGVTGDGIQWLDAQDNPQWLTKRGLRDRLRRRRAKEC